MSKGQKLLMWAIIMVCMPVLWNYAAHHCPLLNDAWVIESVGPINYVAAFGCLLSICVCIGGISYQCEKPKRDEWGPLPTASEDLEEYAENSRKAFLKFLMELEDD